MVISSPRVFLNMFCDLLWQGFPVTNRHQFCMFSMLFTNVCYFSERTPPPSQRPRGISDLPMPPGMDESYGDDDADMDIDPDDDQKLDDQPAKFKRPRSAMIHVLTL